MEFLTEGDKGYASCIEWLQSQFANLYGLQVQPKATEDRGGLPGW